MLTAALAFLGYAVTALAFSWFYADWPGRLAAGTGAALGVFGARWLGPSRLRSMWIVLGFFVALGATLLFRTWLLAKTPLVTILGGALTAVTLIDSGMFLLVCFWAGLCLRSLAMRHRLASVGEWALIVAVFAQLFAAHRRGAINRPFSLADPLLAQGYDPVWALLGIGAVVALLGAVLLVREGRWWRMMLHVLVFLVVLGGVVAVVELRGLPASTSSQDALGLRGKRKPTQGGSSGKQKPTPAKNDEMEFRDNYDSDMDRSPVAVVLFHDDYSPPQGVYYFRQNTFSQYNGRRLVTATRADVDVDVAPGFPARPMTLITAAKPGHLRKRMETTMALLVEHSRPPALETAVKIAPSQNRNPGRFRRTYEVLSASLNTEYLGLLGAKAGSSAWSRAQTAHYLLGPDDPRYRELTTRILSEMPPELRYDPLAQAVAISGWLSRNGTYSLRHGHAKAEDPTADFLFGDKTGYCIHFAHAAAYLMRQAGLPTRVATGYAVNEESRHGGSALLLSGADSHAWPEVYFDDVGWVIMDIFPERSLDKPPPPPDPDLQRLMGELLRGQKPLLTEDTPGLPDIRKATASLLVWSKRIGLGLLLATLLILFGVKYWRLWIPRIARAEHQPRLRYRAALDRLAEQGYRRQYGETREAFAARLEAIAPTFTALSMLHLRWCFGEKTPEAPQKIAQQYHLFESYLHQSRCWYQRLGAALVPWSWFRSQ